MPKSYHNHSNNCNNNREVATITIYPSQGHSHSSANDLCALAAYSRSLLHALPDIERKRHVVFSNRKNNFPEYFEDNNIAIQEVWQKGRLKYFIQIIRAVKSIPSLRLIHLQHEFNQFGGTLTVPLIPLMLFIIRFILKKQVIITFHEVVGKEILTPELMKIFCLPIPPIAARLIFKLYYKITSFSANMVCVQHQKIKTRLINEINIKRKVQILPIGTETDILIPDRTISREILGFDSYCRVLLFFGTIDWRKGLDILLDAFAMLPENKYRLLIGGGQPLRIKDRPEYKQWYKGIADRIAACPRIRHLGFVADKDVPGLFSASDLIVLPYVIPQTVSAVLNHAASYERPFIGSTAFAGHVDPIVLFESTPEAFAKKIDWAFENLNILLRYTLQYKGQNSWSKSAELLANYYRDVIQAI